MRVVPNSSSERDILWCFLWLKWTTECSQHKMFNTLKWCHRAIGLLVCVGTKCFERCRIHLLIQLSCCLCRESFRFFMRSNSSATEDSKHSTTTFWIKLHTTVSSHKLYWLTLNLHMPFDVRVGRFSVKYTIKSVVQLLMV